MYHGQQIRLPITTLLSLKLMKPYHRQIKDAVCHKTRNSSCGIKRIGSHNNTRNLWNSYTFTHTKNKITLTNITSFSFFPLTGCSTLQQLHHHFEIKLNFEINNNSRMVNDFSSYKAIKTYFNWITWLVDIELYMVCMSWNIISFFAILTSYGSQCFLSIYCSI